MKSKRVRSERVDCTRQFNANYVRHEVSGVKWGRLKTRDRKTRDWKTRHQTAGVENARVAQYGKPKSPLFNIVTSVLQQPLELM